MLFACERALIQTLCNVVLVALNHAAEGDRLWAKHRYLYTVVQQGDGVTSML
jgi:hypothetical protein